jgi:AraC family transcriptional regulator
MYKLREELLHPGFGSDTMLELIVAQLGLELSRHILGIGEEFVTGGLAPWRLRLIDEMLENDPANATSLKMAGLCNLSLRQLARAFRQSRGYSLGTFIATRRLDKAKHLLASGSAVKQAAHAAGFTSSSSFSFAFRKMTGETPREFKQGLKRRD